MPIHIFNNQVNKQHFDKDFNNVPRAVVMSPDGDVATYDLYEGDDSFTQCSEEATTTTNAFVRGLSHDLGCWTGDLESFTIEEWI